METEITSIKIKLGCKTVELLIEDAQELYGVLKALFEKEVVIQKEYIPIQPICPCIEDGVRLRGSQFLVNSNDTRTD